MAVGQERVGPIAADAVQAYIDQGQVTDASFVWAEGMDDWSPLGEVPALSRLLPLGDEGQNLLAEEPSDEATSAVAPPSPFSNPSDVPTEDDPQGAADLFVSDHAEATFDEPGDSPVVSTAQLMGQRHENSVLFSLDSLDNDDAGTGGAANGGMMHPSATKNTEGSGLIDLAMLGGDNENLDKVFNVTGPASAPMGAPIKPMASLVTQPRSNKTGLFIGVAIFAALLCGIVVFAGLYYLQNMNAPAVATKQTEVASNTSTTPTAAKVETAEAKKPAGAKKPIDKASPVKKDEQNTVTTSATEPPKGVPVVKLSLIHI